MVKIIVHGLNLQNDTVENALSPCLKYRDAPDKGRGGYVPGS